MSDDELIRGIVTCPSCDVMQPESTAMRGEDAGARHYQCRFCGYEFARPTPAIPGFLRRQAN